MSSTQSWGPAIAARAAFWAMELGPLVIWDCILLMSLAIFNDDAV